MNNIKKKNSQKTKTVFTKSQVEAISHRKGHLQIIACPGSGKTEAVSQRIAGMIQEDPYMANIAITGVYATVSFVRSYFLRRVFEKYGIDDNFLRLGIKFVRRIVQGEK